MAGIVAGKLAVVTGAGSGIGQATCKLLAREGAKIIAVDRNINAAKETVESIKKANGLDHLSISLDVGKTNEVKSAIETIVGHYKIPPNIIVNAAGITRDNFLLKLSEADFDEVINVNLKGTYLIMQTFANALASLPEKQPASIINISSIVAKTGNIGQVNYSASKAAVEAMTKTAAKELAQFNIRCNAILPGFIKSPMTDAVPDKIKAKLLPIIPLKRMGQPEEVAELITFLASDKSSYITGACIEITGGY